MSFIEAPTNFYLGRAVNPRTGEMTDDLVYYDSRDLTTHAMVVGMTGSGKTGLCITMLEEAILDNIPAIIIDPKGDITNLLLTFPDLQPNDFEPWINPDDVRRSGTDAFGYATDVASRWRTGLNKWGIVPDRLTWLKHAADYNIYTPGSDAGLPISILASLRAPRDNWAENAESIRENISGIVSALLTLAGINADPVQDKEHVLLSNIFTYNWQQGRDLTLQDLILQVQQPPFEKLGVFPIEQYMSEKARYKLAMELNNIIAAPSFQSWIVGESMDIQQLLYQPNGRPKVSIFYTAHLSETERMFIMTLLLESLLAWMRQQSGTRSLRALFYIDEIFGYFPPYPRNPPTKEPLLRLLKQARAFGLGLILATQNPGDLDYKGLANMGTWFIGRLQSKNDRERVMAGLEELAENDRNLDLDAVERLVAAIQPRTFLMRNIHDREGSNLIHSRWAMNYLAGPLTRNQIKGLMSVKRQQMMAQVANRIHQTQMPMQPPAMPQATPYPSIKSGYSTPPLPPELPGMAHTAQAISPGVTPAPHLPAGLVDMLPPVSTAITQYFLPILLNEHQAIREWGQQFGQLMSNVQATIAYQPVLFAQTAVRFSERKANIYVSREYAFHVAELQLSGLIHWEDHQAPLANRRDLASEPQRGAIFGELPPGFSNERRVKALQTELKDMLYNTARIAISHNPKFKLYGHPDEDPGQFHAQLTQLAREERDAEVDQLSVKYSGLMDRLEDRMRKKQRELDAEKDEIQDRRRESLYTTGEAVLSIFRGRTNYTLSRMSRASRYKRQTQKDLEESRDVIREIEREMFDLEEDYEHKLNAINDKWARIAVDVQEHIVTPYKKDIHIELFGLGWVPYWYFVSNGQPVYIRAFA